MNIFYRWLHGIKLERAAARNKPTQSGGERPSVKRTEQSGTSVETGGNEVQIQIPDPWDR